jgi:hypothetical protein
LNLDAVGLRLNIFDPFAGYRLTYGNSLIHLAYFIAIFMLDDNKNIACKEANYERAKIALLSTHIIIAVFQNVGFFASHMFENDLLAKVLDTLSLLIYHAAIFYTQNQFF